MIFNSIVGRVIITQIDRPHLIVLNRIKRRLLSKYNCVVVIHEYLILNRPRYLTLRIIVFISQILENI